MPQPQPTLLVLENRAPPYANYSVLGGWPVTRIPASRKNAQAKNQSRYFEYATHPLAISSRLLCHIPTRCSSSNRLYQRRCSRIVQGQSVVEMELNLFYKRGC